MMQLTALLSLVLFFFSVEEPLAQGSFTLSIEERRFEEVITPGATSTVPSNFGSNSVVYGHMIAPDHPAGTLYTFTDSITIDNMQPFPFKTFMSRDTLYHIAEGKSSIAGRRIDALTDSMLQCVFEGSSLKISATALEEGEQDTGGGAVLCRTISHQKPDCGSGEYSRLNLPISLGFFFTGIPLPESARDLTWEEQKPLPSYSGLHFFPEMTISLRIVKISEKALTVVLGADTTIEYQRLTMPSGEEIDLLEDRIHIGGTIIIDPKSGVPSTGELRIDEQISYLRPKLSTVPASKRCSYLLRLKTQ